MHAPSEKQAMPAPVEELNTTTRLIHLGMVVFGISSWLTGELAEDFEEAGDHSGYDIHSWLGIALTVFVVLRILYGLVGPRTARFSHWLPWTRERLGQVMQDIRGLLVFRLPDRPTHQGLSGLVQAFGLLVFTWMALTGLILFVMLEPGVEPVGVAHFIEELHEVGESLIPLYLALHVGAVVLHALAGRHKWRRMFFFPGKSGKQE